MLSSQRKVGELLGAFFVVFCIGQSCYPCDSTANANSYCESSETSTIFATLLWRWIAAHHNSAEFWVASFTGILTVATIGLWIATRRLFQGAEKTARLQLRAYLHVHKRELSNVRPGAKPELVLTLRNTGLTPALNVRTWCKIYLLDLPVIPPLDFGFETVGEGSRMTIAAGDEIHIGDDEIGTLSDMDVILAGSSPFGGKKRFWINGRIMYDDIFGNPCWTTFRLHSMEGPYFEDGHKMALRWSSDGNRTEKSRPRDEESNYQESY
jgi:hypothetical protein